MGTLDAGQRKYVHMLAFDRVTAGGPVSSRYIQLPNLDSVQEFSASHYKHKQWVYRSRGLNCHSRPASVFRGETLQPAALRHLRL